MTLLKVTFLLLALLQTARAYDIPPFTWKALEEAEKHASTAATAAASLYAESVRIQQAVRERVFAPEPTPEQSCRLDIEPTTPQRAPPDVASLGLHLVALIAAFLLGWFGGIKQAESSQALQQANVADQADVDARELEKAAELAATSVANPLMAEGRQTLAPNAKSQNHMPVRADRTTPPQWSSPSGSDSDEEILQGQSSHQASAGARCLKPAATVQSCGFHDAAWGCLMRIKHLQQQTFQEMVATNSRWCAGLQLKPRLSGQSRGCTSTSYTWSTSARASSARFA